MWLRQVSLVSLSASQATCSAQKIRETCGRQQGTLFATRDPASSCWKTSQGFLFADTPAPSSVSWPSWGIWDDGGAYQQPPLVPLTYDFDGGLLPTPRANDAEKRGNVANDPRNGLVAWARHQQIPTPTASDWKRTPIKASYANRSRSRLADDLASHIVRESGMAHARLDASLWEWAMGWPITWARLKPLETDRFRQWLEQHGIYSADSTDSVA